MDEQMWGTHPMEYFFAMERNEVLTRAEPRTNLENTMLSE